MRQSVDLLSISSREHVSFHPSKNLAVEREICYTTPDLHLQPEAAMTKQEDVCAGGDRGVEARQISVEGIADGMPIAKQLSLESYVANSLSPL